MRRKSDLWKCLRRKMSKVQNPTSDLIKDPKKRQCVGFSSVGKSTKLKFSSSFLTTILTLILFGIVGLVADKERIKIYLEESETDSEESDVSGSDGDDTSWISWFFDDDYIQDDFNLCRLSSQVPYYDYALDLILDVESYHGDIFTEEQNELIESTAEMLYGLIHHLHLDKYKNYDFGRCPRVYCCGQACLPIGQSDIPRSSSTKHDSDLYVH
ncbi:hypothetical protein UlMin_003362 [Ulmus minor]